MAISAYDVLRDAILNKQQVVCDYHGHAREICPHVLGMKRGREKVLSFQFGGSGSSPLPPKGDWRCMFVDEITNAVAQDGAWHTGLGHTQPQTCVDSIDVEVDY